MYSDFPDDAFLTGFMLGILAALSLVCVVLLVLVEGRHPRRRKRDGFRMRRGPSR